MTTTAKKNATKNGATCIVSKTTKMETPKSADLVRSIRESLGALKSVESARRAVSRCIGTYSAESIAGIRTDRTSFGEAMDSLDDAIRNANRCIGNVRDLASVRLNADDSARCGFATPPNGADCAALLVASVNGTKKAAAASLDRLRG